jgi:hypothetical protein
MVLLSALVLIGIYPTFTLFVFREQVKLVVDSAMATTLVFGWITAVLSASHTISREINNGTVLLVLAKPVNRNAFIGGKILGILTCVTLFVFLTSLASLISVRVAKDQFQLDNTALAIYFGAIALSCLVGGLCNFMWRASFPMTAVLANLVLVPAATAIVYFLPVEDGQGRLLFELVPALVLIWFSVLAMGTLATALSTRLDMVPNLIVCGVIFVLGLVSDYLFGASAAQNPFAFLLYTLIPNWQLFWMADAMAAQKHIPWEYVLWAGGYIFFFVAIFYMLAAGLFRDREVGKQALV